MTVAKAIEALLEMPQDAELCMNVETGGRDVKEILLLQQDQNTVWLQ